MRTVSLQILILIVLQFLVGRVSAESQLHSQLHSQSRTQSRAQSRTRTAPEVVDEAVQLRLSESAEWLNLLDYRKNFFGGYTSDATGKAYFVSERGRTDPEAELTADIIGFFSTLERPSDLEKSPAQTVRCQFPARWHFIADHLGLNDNDIPKQSCELFEGYRAELAAESATLVFSSYYLNNPSSAFGHTFLRINQKRLGSKAGSELIDNGIGYAANPTTQNPLIYALYGFIGGFNGVFTKLPYYNKVHEYNDFESRDLWEYELNLSASEVERLVEHLWEMGSANFPYFYLSKNCAYYILSAVEASAPRLNLLQKLPFYIIPVDTIRAAAREPGLLGNVVRRPSIRTQFESRFSILGPTEVEIFRQNNSPELFNLGSLQALSPRQKARTVDTLLDWIDFHYRIELEKKDRHIDSWKQALLVERTNLPFDDSDEKAYRTNISETVRPDLGHKSGRVTLGVGSSIGSKEKEPKFNRGSYLIGEFRFALHDILDPLEGYPPYASIEFFRLRAEYFPVEKKALIENFRLIEATSLVPFTSANYSLAWKFGIGERSVADRRCARCGAATGEVATGLSIQPDRHLVAYLLFGPTVEGSPEFVSHRFTIAGQGTLGARVKLAQRFSLGIEYRLSWIQDFSPFISRETTVHARWVPDLTNGIDAECTFRSESPSSCTLSFIRYF